MPLPRFKIRLKILTGTTENRPGFSKTYSPKTPNSAPPAKSCPFCDDKARKRT